MFSSRKVLHLDKHSSIFVEQRDENKLDPREIILLRALLTGRDSGVVTGVPSSQTLLAYLKLQQVKTDHSVGIAAPWPELTETLIKVELSRFVCIYQQNFCSVITF